MPIDSWSQADFLNFICAFCTVQKLHQKSTQNSKRFGRRFEKNGGGREAWCFLVEAGVGGHFFE